MMNKATTSIICTTLIHNILGDDSRIEVLTLTVVSMKELQIKSNNRIV